MKKILTLTFFSSMFFSVFGQEFNSDQKAVQQVVSESYVQGIQNGGSIETIRKGFHSSFNMLRFTNNEVNPLSIEEWITGIEKYRAENPSNKNALTEAKFLSIDITGTTAIVKLELRRENKLIFTDYITLFQFTEGWKIVSKSYFRH